MRIRRVEETTGNASLLARTGKFIVGDDCLDAKENLGVDVCMFPSQQRHAQLQVATRPLGVDHVLLSQEF
jgi:hypothetical protein